MTTKPTLPAHIVTEPGIGCLTYRNTTVFGATLYDDDWTASDLHAVHDHMLGRRTIPLSVEAVEKIREALETMSTAARETHDTIACYMLEISRALALLPRASS